MLDGVLVSEALLVAFVAPGHTKIFRISDLANNIFSTYSLTELIRWGCYDSSYHLKPRRDQKDERTCLSRDLNPHQ